MREHKCDPELIGLLRTDGRMSVKELAGRLGLPRTHVSNRMQELIDSGTLRVVAALDPEFAGHRLLTHTLVRASRGAATVAARLREMPQTVFVSAIAGTHDVAFESRFGTEAELTDLLAKVRAFPEVSRITTSKYISVVKGFFVAHYRGNVTIDDVDRTMISMLEQDGRVPYRALADASGVSASTARERIARLLDANVIRISAVEARGVKQSQVGVGVGIVSRGTDGDIQRFMRSARAVDFAASAYGRYDFIATLVAPSPRQLHVVLDELRSLESVVEVDAWTHLDVVKEEYGRTLRPAQLEGASIGEPA